MINTTLELLLQWFVSGIGFSVGAVLTLVAVAKLLDVEADTE